MHRHVNKVQWPVACCPMSALFNRKDVTLVERIVRCWRSWPCC